VISDTHGLLRPDVLTRLSGCDLILHAGDVGDPSILEALRQVAPLHAVRGNVDGGALRSLPATEAVEIGGHLLYMVHIPDDLDLDPVSSGVSVVIHGHTHRSRIDRRDGVIYLNPGSVGPRRFDLPVTMALLRIGPDGIEPEIIEIEV
jgi:putative phosphoesterase